MNLVMDEADEVYMKTNKRRPIGRPAMPSLEPCSSATPSLNQSTLTLSMQRCMFQPGFAVVNKQFLSSLWALPSLCPGRILLRGDNITLISPVETA